MHIIVLNMDLYLQSMESNYLLFFFIIFCHFYPIINHKIEYKAITIEISND